MKKPDIADNRCADDSTSTTTNNPKTYCAFICPTIYKPICALDSDTEKKTFSNRCSLHSYNCNSPDSGKEL